MMGTTRNRRDFLHAVLGTGAVLSVSHRTLAADIAYTVPGSVPAIDQMNMNLCWLATAAILASWRDRTTYTLAMMAARLGRPYTEFFATQAPFPGSDQPALAKAAGLRTEPPANYSINALLKMLMNFGPLWVTTSITPVKPFSTHSRVLTGIFGDGTLGGTDLTLLNPDGAVTDVVNYADFVALFESIAKEEQVVGATSFIVQIIHV